MLGLGMLGVLLGLVLSGCGEKPGPGPLVRVGESDIDVLEVREYASKLPEQLRPKEHGEVALRNLLRSLVASRVLLLEARDQGLDRDPKVLLRAHRAVVRKLTERLVKEEIAPRVHFTEAELRERYREDHWDRVHRPAHILSASAEDAWEVVRLLREGADFAELARARSLAADAAHGGDMGRYFGPGEVVPEIGKAVLGLAVGGVTDPIRTRDGWEVITVLDARDVPFAAVQGKLATLLTRRKLREERLAYVRSLESRFQVRYDSAGTAALIRSKSPSEVEDVTLVTYTGGAISTRNESVADAFRGVPQRLLTDHGAVVAVVRERIMADSLLMFEARRRGMDKAEDIVALYDGALRQAMLTRLRRDVALRRVEVTAAEVEAAYAKHAEQYRQAATMKVCEILVDTAEEARELIARIDGGERMADLAWSHSKRPGVQRVDGVWTVNPAGGEGWGSLLKLFLEAPVGQLSEPVRTADGFSVFRVEQRQEGRLRPLAEVEEIVRHGIRRRKAEELFQEYTRNLVARYADRTQWFDARIAAEAASGNW